MPAWDPEIVVDERLAGELVAAQFPELAGRPLRFLAAGWDNAVHVVDDRWAFRFPQRAIAVPGIEREIGLLPRLGPMLPAPIPDPIHLGRPGDVYPWPFFGARLLAGGELAAAGLDEPARHRFAGELGAFLRALHAPEPAARFGASLLIDPMRRADMPHRIGVAREWLAQVAGPGIWETADDRRAEQLFAEAAALPAREPGGLRLAHGDLHLRHALVQPDGRLAAVIDWGDMCIADPAIDLSLAWSYLQGAARGAFLAAYGGVDRATELRARVLGLMLSGALVAYARDQGIGWLDEEAAAGLRRSLEGYVGG